MLPHDVVPYVGTWIEIAWLAHTSVCCSVVPYVGTWIEIIRRASYHRDHKRRSLRGNVDRNLVNIITVSAHNVVPYVGTWIEIFGERRQITFFRSFPTWERG